jgi:NitT/TauT family transport system ATP-binding protein
MNELIVCQNVTKRFPLPGGKAEFTALENISLSVHRGEVLALLGRSGSGKSTLLRMMAGLIPPSDGTIINGGSTLRGPNSDVSMVFQSFALLPWLTVLENVELGLEARGVNRASRARRALRVIDLVGLDGFEGAYPKELSGGMKQRVGYARALAVEPKVLFMDEPFSALDVLTAENLRGEIDELWNAGNFPSASILLVTHNIEEAVLLADRVIVLGSNPGHIRGEVRIDLPRPHDRNAQHFKDLVDHLYGVMTNPEADVARTATAAAVSADVAGPTSPFATALPHVRIGGVSGLLELLAQEEGASDDISDMAEGLAITADDLLTILDAAVLLDFAKISDGKVSLTDAGRTFATTTILHSKDVFREQLLACAPIFNAIVKTLGASRSKSIPADFFLDLWDEYFPEEEVQRQFATAVDWGRYAELFEYDTNERVLRLHEEAPEDLDATA